MEKNAVDPLNDLPGKPSCLMIIGTYFSLQKSHDDRLNKARVITKTEIKQKINVFRHSFITFVTEKMGVFLYSHCLGRKVEVLRQGCMVKCPVLMKISSWNLPGLYTDSALSASNLEIVNT